MLAQQGGGVDVGLVVLSGAQEDRQVLIAVGEAEAAEVQQDDRLARRPDEVRQAGVAVGEDEVFRGWRDGAGVGQGLGRGPAGPFGVEIILVDQARLDLGLGQLEAFGEPPVERAAG